MSYTILGAGLAGLSCTYHLGHDECIVFEKTGYAGGHIYSHARDGFIWDEGPHVSFTKNDYVRNLFEKSVGKRLLEFPVEISNYFHGSWIPHPAQSNLFAVPEPLRAACYQDYLQQRLREEESVAEPGNYADWLTMAFGETFANTFSAAYTRKYWTLDPQQLAIDWVGNRVFMPDLETIRHGYTQPAARSTHYINKVRYPERGGYVSFAEELLKGAQVKFDHKVTRIDLAKRRLWFANGFTHEYEKLISTIPLPELVRLSGAPEEVLHAANQLCCTSLLLVNVAANHTTAKPYHWMYVYDEEKYSTRINCTEMLALSNAPNGKTGVQVEVYESRYRPLDRPDHEIAAIVCDELKEMGLIQEVESFHTKRVQWANVVFDQTRRASQEVILAWLEQFGLKREDDDLEPMTDWENNSSAGFGDLILAGRFGQWKYFWTDDCVLRGRSISEES